MMILALLLDWLAYWLLIWLWGLGSEACGVTGTC